MANGVGTAATDTRRSPGCNCPSRQQARCGSLHPPRRIEHFNCTCLVRDFAWVPTAGEALDVLCGRGLPSDLTVDGAGVEPGAVNTFAALVFGIGARDGAGHR
jgi:hypothetical protein